MSEQLAIRFPDDVVRRVDALVKAKRFESRAAVVRQAVVDLLAAETRRAEGEAIASGYRTRPQTDEEVSVARAAALRAISEEPW
jgi:Arc/MetJ-type ribon-helix-helix transcriptional regulator